MPRFRTKTKKAEIMPLEEAAKTFMHDGIMCAFSGFTGFNRNPFAFAWQTARQGVKNIHVIDRHGSCCTWLLNAVGAIKVYETDWMGWGEMAGKLDINLEKRYKAGGDDSRGLLARRHGHAVPGRRDRRTLHSLQRAAGIGPLQSQVRCVQQGRHERRQEFQGPQEEVHPDGRALLGRGRHGAAAPARPELSIIHVAQCGDKGTARWRGVGTIDKEISFAADRVVILAEEVVPESEMRKLPEANQIPYFVVDAIVECPWGAFPSSVPFYYDYDAPFMRDMDKASRSAEDQKKWLDEWVYGPKNWEDFIVKLGAKRLLDLKADSVTGYSTRMMRGKKPAPRMKMPLSVAISGY